MSIDKNTLDALGQVLREERVRVDARIDAISPNNISNSATVEKRNELEQTLLRYLDAYFNEKSQIVSGRPCELVKRSIR